MSDPGEFVCRDGVIKKYYGQCRVLVIPEGTVELGEGALENNAYVVSVTLPEGVKKIGARAFRGCTALTEIHIPGTVTDIGDEAFRRCDKLKKLTLPTGELRLGRQAFRGCKSLADREGFVTVGQVLYGYFGESDQLHIPARVRKIDPCVFADYPYATHIRLPEGMTALEDQLFRGCQDLTEVCIPDTVTHLGSQTFRFCPGLANEEGFVIVRNRLWSYFGPGGAVTVPEGVTVIEEGAFYGCKQVTSLEIPRGVIAIEEGAFRGCQNLLTVRMEEGVTTIGKQAFSFCTQLTGIHIPKSVKQIREEAFDQCEKLKVLELEEGLETVDDFAFRQCDGLTEVTVPNSVTRLGVGVFSGCRELRRLTLPVHVRLIDQGSLNQMHNLQVLVMPGVTPERFLRKPAQYAAAAGFLLHRARYTEQAVADSYRSYVSRNRRAILPILLGLDAAGGLAELLALSKTKPKDFEKDYIQPAQRVGADSCLAFLMDWSNRNLPQESEFDLFLDQLEQDPLDPEQLKESWSFKRLPDGTMHISGYKGSQTQATFPPRIGKKPVTVIGTGVLNPARLTDGMSVEQVIIPEGVTTIEERAFFHCEKLRAVVLPRSIQSIGPEAFSGCPGLQDNNGFVIIGDRLFNYYGTAAEPVVPEGVRVIEAGAFRQRLNLTGVTLPESLEQIGEGAFDRCSQLTRIRIPGGVQSIGELAFSECENLKTVTVAEGVKTLSDSCFSGCEKLQRLTLPASVKAIGLWAFDRCSIMTIHTPAGSYA